MIIRAYDGLPITYTADIGEVVDARLSPVDPFVPAVVTAVSRRRDGAIRYVVVWLRTQPGTTAVAGAKGRFYVRPGRPPLLRQRERPEASA